MMTPSAIARVESEEAQQTAYFLWCAINKVHSPELEWAFAIPNGGKRDVITAGKLKAQGVKPGVPDVMVPSIQIVGTQTFAGLWLELKKRKGGIVSEDQRRWQAYLSNHGYAHRICAGYEAMRDATKQYLGINRPWKDT
jgi:hypothetical protein